MQLVLVMEVRDPVTDALHIDVTYKRYFYNVFNVIGASLSILGFDIRPYTCVVGFHR